MSTIRLNKYLASQGIASRRKIDQLIKTGAVEVNNLTAKLGQKIDPSSDIIKIDGKQLKFNSQQLVYFMLHKPKQVVSTASDTHDRKTVLDLLAENFPNLKQRVYPVGRLDYDSEGLILLTNDGSLTQKLTHPKHHVAKVYQVWLKYLLTLSLIARLEKGIKLDEGITTPVKIRILANKPQQILEITLYQGWKRQIRRMIEFMGGEVVRLKRVATDALELGDLEVGKARELSGDEVRRLQQHAK